MFIVCDITLEDGPWAILQPGAQEKTCLEGYEIDTALVDSTNQFGASVESLVVSSHCFVTSGALLRAKNVESSRSKMPAEFAGRAEKYAWFRGQDARKREDRCEVQDGHSRAA